MAKIAWKPGTMIYPIPAAMVSCGASPEDFNIITIAWTGTVNSDPPMCYISIRKSRHSYAIVEKYKEFVINITNKELAFATDWCGVRSGKDYDKFKEMQLTPEAGQIVKAPLIKESPLNIECKVKQIIPLGSHDMFLSEVVAVNADEEYFEEERGKFHLNHSEPIAYSHGSYFTLGNKIGKFGFSVQKKKKKKKK